MATMVSPSASRPSRKYCIAPSASLHLGQQQARAGAFPGGAELLKCRTSAGSIDGHGPQQRAQLVSRSLVERAPGALGEPRDLAEGHLRSRVASFLEQEHRDAMKRQLAGAAAEVVDRLLHAVADIDEGV